MLDKKRLKHEMEPALTTVIGKKIVFAFGLTAASLNLCGNGSTLQDICGTEINLLGLPTNQWKPHYKISICSGDTRGQTICMQHPL